MKTNNFLLKSLIMTILGTSSLILESCNNNDEIESPPMNFTAEIAHLAPATSRSIVDSDSMNIQCTVKDNMDNPLIENSSRSNTVNGRWSAGDNVAVQVGGAVHSYSNDGSGNLTSTDPFFWPDNSTVDVSAWFPYSSSYPSYSVQSDQSKFEAYQASDLLYASATNFVFGTNSALTFKHVGTKITANIQGADSYTVKIAGITPYQSGTNTYNALMVPGSYKGKVLFSITVGENVYTYVPEGDVNFDTGKEYTYNVTLKKNTIEVGDYLFSDGTWGKIENNKNKTAIAVIFSKETSALDKAKGWTHGYAAALGSFNDKWSVSTSLEDIPVYKLQGSDITASQNKDGYTLTRTIVSNSKISFTKENYPAFWNAINYNVIAPQGSSGWFLPSCGQFCDLINNLGNGVMFTAGIGYDGAETIINNLNKYFNLGTPFIKSQVYWLAGQIIHGDYGAVMAFGINGTDKIAFWASSKKNSFPVRPVLAF